MTGINYLVIRDDYLTLQPITDTLHGLWTFADDRWFREPISDFAGMQHTDAGAAGGIRADLDCFIDIINADSARKFSWNQK